MKRKSMATFNDQPSTLSKIGSWTLALIIVLFLASAESIVDILLKWMGI